MPEKISFDYAIIRLVPYVERQEFINVGVIIFCRKSNYLNVMIDFELGRLPSFAPHADINMIQNTLHAIEKRCMDSDKKSPNSWNKSQCFHWLISPSSSIIQMSPVHSGFSECLPKTLEELYELFVSYTKKG